MRQTAFQQNKSLIINRSIPTLALQHKCACGNHAFGGVECRECSKKKRSGLQTKLNINEPGDNYEREADRIADQVMTTPAHHAVSGALPSIQRYSGQSSGQMDAVPATVDQALASPGRVLEPALRQDMEQRFGYDFSQVRVHSGSAAEQSAREVSANAYTLGHNIVFGAGRFVPATQEGQRLIAHELTHVVQQSGADGFRSDRINEEQGSLPSLDVLRAQPEGRPEQSRVATGAAMDLERQRVAGNHVVMGLLQRQEMVTSDPAAAPSGHPVGDAVQPEVEGFLKTFASAKGYEAQNAAAMQAVRAIICAYSMSTKGLKTMRYNPDLKHGTYAQAPEADDNKRESVIEFGPESFSKGFAHLVHVVAHELEHVSQAVIGGVYPEGGSAVREFLAYTSSILQVQTVAGPTGRGFLGALMRGDNLTVPALPPLPPDILEEVALNALATFMAMSSAEQKKFQYRQFLAAAGNKLLDRLKNEAPAALRPPMKFTPEWSRWYEGQAPTLDILTPEYQDWQDALKSPWNRVKAVWKKFDAAFRVR